MMPLRRTFNSTPTIAPRAMPVTTPEGAKTALQLPVSGAAIPSRDVLRMERLKFFRPGGAVQTTPFGGASAGSSGSSGGPGGGAGGDGALPSGGGASKPRYATSTPPLTTVPTVPDTSAAEAAARLNQQQYLQSSVSVPVNVRAFPTTSITIAPEREQDYGRMVPAAFSSDEGFLSTRCLVFAALGAIVAYLMKERGHGR